MRTGLVFIVILIACNFTVFAQTLGGVVRDKETGERIAFVNIAFIDREGKIKGGTATDVEGRFTWQPASEIHILRISAVGYQTLTVPIDLSKQSFYEIFMNKVAKELSEVTIYAGENPAHAIIQKVVANKPRHDPEKITEYAHKIYGKFVITVDGTLAAEQILADNALKNKYLTDSLSNATADDERLMQAFSQKHLFMSETISERKFRAPGMVKEVVLANRISGFQNPFFSILASNLQPFGFYRDFITFFDKDYLSPFTKNSTTRYRFILEDSTIVHQDTIYLISFEPLKGMRFEGLKGVAGISKSDYAIQQLIAQTFDSTAMVTLRFRQLYERQQGGRWFPVQLNTLLKFNGQTIGRNNHLIGIGTAYVTDIRIGEGTAPVKDFNHIALETSTDAGKRDSLYWQANRLFPLSALEQNTYTFMDSVLGKTGIETFANIALALSADVIPAGKLNLIPSKMLRMNRFEGVRLGIGAETGTSFSKIFSLGAYAGIGTRDKALKYGGWLRFDLSRKRGIYASLIYRQDIAESGQVVFGSPWQRQSLSANTLRNILGINMDSVREVRLDWGLRPLRRNLIASFSAALQEVRPTYGYGFRRTDSNGAVREQTSFRFTEATADLLFFSGENNVQIMGRTVFSRHRFPVIKLRLTQGLDILGGEFNYQKVDLSFEQVLRVQGAGRTRLKLDAGIAQGQMPLMKMYFMAGGDAVESRLVYVNNAFQTVGLYEFAADRYAALFLEHDLGAIYRGWRYSRPTPTIVQSMAWGAMNQPENHTGVTFQVPRQGIFETGLVINHLLRVVYAKTFWLGLGVGVFQRYGAYAFAQPTENRTFRVLLKLDF